MLGTFRLCLALLVALSHVGFSLFGINPGPMAVVCFYLLSGYVMTGLIRKHYSRISTVPHFYLDRAMRLLPHYFVIVCLTLLWFDLTDHYTDFITLEPSWIQYLNNVLIVPLNYSMFNHAAEFTLIPPAWSLGAEIQFYFILPFILLFSIRKPVIGISLGVFLCAVFGLIDTGWYGFRLLPGVLFIFLIGSLLFDHRKEIQTRLFSTPLLRTIFLSLALLTAVLVVTQHIFDGYNREVLLGLALGIVVISLLAHRPRKPLDEFFGNISYGVFLNHFLVKWTVFNGVVSGFSIVFYVGLSMFLATIIYYLAERPILKARKDLRRGEEQSMYSAP